MKYFYLDDETTINTIVARHRDKDVSIFFCKKSKAFKLTDDIRLVDEHQCTVLIIINYFLSFLIRLSRKQIDITRSLLDEVYMKEVTWFIRCTIYKPLLIRSHFPMISGFI